eukprot:gnl/TRDRNA2_/TRDRNA2_34841_c0_seq1.p1 gnl/TRDRNA2_/TRDRNA2_34841_c0~~gnl/TRDRNA2_/TRDRNA2_34841_c0_seq1.p1  ORF type:complete len:498 (-),score=50.38 gnl/TRDRNA2_/TRDRNA2_34841_c0_seq1:470-1963(-)
MVVIAMSGLELILFCTVCAATGLHAFLTIWKLYVHLRDGHLTTPSIVFSIFTSSNSHDAVDHHTKMQMQEKRVRRLNGSISVALPCCFLWMSMFILEKVMLIEKPRTLVQSMIWASGYIALLILNSFDHIITTRTCDIVYSFFYLLVVLSAAPGVTTAEKLLVDAGGVLLLRLLLGVSSLNGRLTLLWNALYTVVASCAALSSEHTCEEIVRMSSVMVRQDAVNSIFLVLIIFFLERSATFETAKDIAATASRAQHSAVLRLLHQACDVVVELDAKLLLKEHCPALATMLLHGTGCGSNKGDCFDQYFFSAADRQKFSDYIQKETTSPECMTGPLQFQMRDSVGNRVEIELFHQHCADLDGDVNHLIGIREHMEGILTEMDRSLRSIPSASGLSQGQPPPMREPLQCSLAPVQDLLPKGQVDRQPLQCSPAPVRVGRPMRRQITNLSTLSTRASDTSSSSSTADSLGKRCRVWVHEHGAWREEAEEKEAVDAKATMV